jgi:hypothetical protein
MKKIEEIILELYEIKNKSKRMQDEYKIRIKYLEKKIDEIFTKKKETSYSFCCQNRDSDIYYKATLVQPKKIEWNMDVLQQVLNKKIFNQICNKKYTIIDYEGLTNYLKTVGADPKVFKNFISCEKTMNDKMLNQLSELGEITEKDLEGCYTVTNREQYVKITTSTEEDEEDS